MALSICVSLTGAGGEFADAAVVRTLTLKWAPVPQPIIGYEVYCGKTRKRHRMRQVAVPHSFNLAAPAVRFNILRDLAALPGQKVCFRVKAYYNTLKPAFSQAVCATV